MKTVIRNGLVVNNDCTAFLPLDIVLRDGLIEKLLPRGTAVEDATVIDAQGQYILPGLIDIHNHGALGVYYAFSDDFTPALELFARHGVTTVLASTGCTPMEELLASIRRILEKQKTAPGARIGGIHMEGPFLSSEKRGAMTIPDIPCTVENFLKFYEAAQGQLRVMTIAPERENALDVIRAGVERGVRMSLGHTNATYQEAMAGIRAGATGSTHTFNGMRSLLHRDPGVLGAVLTEPEVICEAICDLVHLSPAIVKLILAAKGTDKMILISDAVYITGFGDGEYRLGTQHKFVKNGVARLANGTIAGSCFTMADGARNLISLGCSLLDIAKVGARNPALATGLTDRGMIKEGLLADLIITDENMQVSSVILRGELVDQGE